jgi:beta-lactamase family protein
MDDHLRAGGSHFRRDCWAATRYSAVRLLHRQVGAALANYLSAPARFRRKASHWVVISPALPASTVLSGFSLAVRIRCAEDGVLYSGVDLQSCVRCFLSNVPPLRSMKLFRKISFLGLFTVALLVRGYSGTAAAATDPVTLNGYGVRNVAKPSVVNEHTIFQLASVTKTLTAAAAATVVEEGKLDWDKPIFNYLPEFVGYDPYMTRWLTERDLLAQRTGWPAYTGDQLDSFGYDRAEILRRLRFFRPRYSLREVAQYSNPGFFLAGEAAARVDALSEKVRSGLMPEQWKLYVDFGFTKPTPGLEKYKDIEMLDVNASLDQIEKAAAAKPLRPIPLFVLTQGQPFDLTPWQPLPADFPGALNKAWHAAQDELATLVPNAKHKVATKSSHYIQFQEPQLVIDAIKQVVEAVRNPSAWTTAPTQN